MRLTLESSTVSAALAGRRRDGQRLLRLQLPVERGLHGVEQAAARERIHPLQRLEIVSRTQAIDRAQQKTDTGTWRTSAAR